MECKKCKSIIEDNANFCPYCGEKVKEEETYSDPFASYRQDFSHASQYQYQQQYSNIDSSSATNPITYVDRPKKNGKANSYSVIGLILSLVSIFLSFVHFGFAAFALVLSLVLLIVGFRHTSTGMKVASIILFILSTISVIVITFVLFALKLEINFSNGYETTLKDYLTDSFFSTFQIDDVYGIWVSQDGEVFDLRSTSQFTYYTKDGKVKYQGNYYVSEGYQLSDGDLLYADNDYYFYDFHGEGRSFLDGVASVVCIQKKNSNVMRVFIPQFQVYIEYQRVSSHPFLNGQFEVPSDDDSETDFRLPWPSPTQDAPGIIG